MPCPYAQWGVTARAPTLILLGLRAAPSPDNPCRSARCLTMSPAQGPRTHRLGILFLQIGTSLSVTMPAETMNP